MSTDYSATLAIGYRVTDAELIAFKRKKREEFHWEKRFDTKNGTPLPDEKVVTQEQHYVLVLDDAEYEYFDEFVRDLAAKIECDANISSIDEFREQWRGAAILGPRFKHNQDGRDPHPHFYVGGSIDYQKVVDAAGEIERIGKALADLGIRVRKPIVGLTTTYG